jgi:DNA-binding MarR family transcriptional regulator
MHSHVYQLIRSMRDYRNLSEGMKQVIRNVGYAHHELTPIRFILLSHIHQNPNRCTSQLGELMGTSGGSVDLTLKDLVDKNFLDTELGEPTDKYRGGGLPKRHYSLTPKGKEAIDRVNSFLYHQDVMNKLLPIERHLDSLPIEGDHLINPHHHPHTSRITIVKTTSTPEGYILFELNITFRGTWHRITISGELIKDVARLKDVIAGSAVRNYQQCINRS